MTGGYVLAIENGWQWTMAHSAFLIYVYTYWKWWLTIAIWNYKRAYIRYIYIAVTQKKIVKGISLPFFEGTSQQVQNTCNFIDFSISLSIFSILNEHTRELKHLQTQIYRGTQLYPMIIKMCVWLYVDCMVVKKPRWLPITWLKSNTNHGKIKHI